MSKHNGSIERVLDALACVGDMTAREVAEYLDIPRDSAASLLAQLRRTTTYRERRAHICAYTYDAEGTSKPYPRPVYRFGPGDDAKKPRAKSGAEKSRKSRAGKVARNRSASVFSLAAGYRSSAEAARRRELDAARYQNDKRKGRSDAG